MPSNQFIYGKLNGSTYTVTTSASFNSALVKYLQVVLDVSDSRVPTANDYFVQGYNSANSDSVYVNEMWSVLLVKLPIATIKILGNTHLKGNIQLGQ